MTIDLGDKEMPPYLEKIKEGQGFTRNDRSGNTLRFSRAAGLPPRALHCGVKPMPSSRRSLRVFPALKGWIIFLSILFF